MFRKKANDRIHVKIAKYQNKNICEEVQYMCSSKLSKPSVHLFKPIIIKHELHSSILLSSS